MKNVTISYTKPDGTVESGGAELVMQAIVNSVGNLQTRAYFGVNTDGNVTGIVATDSSGTETTGKLSLLGSAVEILNEEDGEPFVSYDTENKRGIIRGLLILEDGTNVSSAGDITGADGADGVGYYALETVSYTHLTLPTNREV